MAANRIYIHGTDTVCIDSDPELSGMGGLFPDGIYCSIRFSAVFMWSMEVSEKTFSDCEMVCFRKELLQERIFLVLEIL